MCIVPDAVSVQPPREVFQPKLALKVAAALRRGKSEMRMRSVGRRIQWEWEL